MRKKAAKQRHRRPHAPKPPGSRPMSDKAVYIGIGIVGLFTVLLGWLFTDGLYWQAVALAYILLVAYLINLATFQVYRGKEVSNLQQSLARLPLRFIGYGTKEGKPLEAAHDHPETRTALLASILISALVIAALAALVIPALIR
jgi:hypothetical protein